MRAADRQGIAHVQLEQVLAWNPDTIVTWDRRFYAAVAADPAWAGVAAVRARARSPQPGLPFGWIDRPPSLNRLIGLRWLAGVFYPDLVRQDLRAETREFYRLFYQVELDEPAARPAARTGRRQGSLTTRAAPSSFPA